MVLTREGAGSLDERARAKPIARPGELLVRVRACGVCRTDLNHGRDVFAFTSPGDQPAQLLARQLGAVWAGASIEAPPAPLDAAMIFASVGAVVLEALSHIAAGGTAVGAGIHMSDVPTSPYRLLWEERIVRSAASLTRQDAREFLAVAATVRLHAQVQAYGLTDANRALADHRGGRVNGAALLVVDGASS